MDISIPSGTFRRVPSTSAENLTVAVVVATHSFERLGMLDAALSSVKAGTHQPERLVVVVDHNAALHRRLAGDLPERFGCEVLLNDGVRGLGATRNVAVSHLARSVDAVAFLDDDAVAVPGWLDELVAPFANPDVYGVGGWADAAWETSRPAWFPPTFDWVIGCSWDGLDKVAADIRNPIGCSMAFRSEAFDRIGGFRSDMGRRGTTPLGCEETEFAIRLRQQIPHSRVVLAPDAAVTQVVPVARARMRYFLRRCWAEGLSKASMTTTIGTAAGLSEERRHLALLARRAAADVRHLRVARAAATVAGTATTAAGYATGHVTTSVTRLREGARR